MDFSQKPAPMSPNLQVQKPPQTLDDLMGIYAPTPQHQWMGPDYRVTGMPLNDMQVEQYARRELGYTDPNEDEIARRLGFSSTQEYLKQKALMEALKNGAP